MTNAIQPQAHRWLRILAGFALTSLAAGCSSRGTPLPDLAFDINKTYDASRSVKLAPGDQLSVRFPLASQFDFETTVQEDGTAAFIFLASQPVAGMDVQAVDDLLTRSYETDNNLKNPNLTVFRVATAPRNVTVFGDVRSPGRVDIEAGQLTLLEAIGKAGGPWKQTANMGNVILVRWLAGEERLMAWRIDLRPKYWATASIVRLQPHDVVFVPNTAIDDVDIWLDQYVKQMIPLPGSVPAIPIP